MGYIKKIIKLFRDAGRTGWVALITLLLPIIGTAFLLIYLVELEAIFRGQEDYKVIIFLFATMLLVGTSVLPSYVAGIAGGWIFGFSMGLVTSLTGIVLAAVFGFWLSRFLVCERFVIQIGSFEKYKNLEALLKKKKFHTITLIALIRLSPIFPFALTNVIMASLKMPIAPFLSGTMVGMLPRTAAAVLFGSELLKLSFENPADSWLVCLGLLGTFFLVYFLARIANKPLNEEDHFC